MNKKISTVPSGRWVFLSWVCKEPLEVNERGLELMSRLGFSHFDELIFTAEFVSEGCKYYVGVRTEAGQTRYFLEFKLPKIVEELGLDSFIVKQRKSWYRVQESAFLLINGGVWSWRIVTPPKPSTMTAFVSLCRYIYVCLPVSLSAFEGSGSDKQLKETPHPLFLIESAEALRVILAEGCTVSTSAFEDQRWRGKPLSKGEEMSDFFQSKASLGHRLQDFDSRLFSLGTQLLSREARLPGLEVKVSSMRVINLNEGVSNPDTNPTKVVIEVVEEGPEMSRERLKVAKRVQELLSMVVQFRESGGTYRGFYRKNSLHRLPKDERIKIKEVFDGSR